MNLVDNFPALLLLFLISTIYLLATFPKTSDDKKTTKTQPGGGEGRPPTRGWCEHIKELKIFLPLLVPKDVAIRRQMIFDYSVVMVCLGADRLIKLASPILLRQVVDVLASDDRAAKRLPWVEVLLFVICHSILGKVVSDVSSTYQSQATGRAEDAITVALYNKLLEQSAEYHENSKSGTVDSEERNGFKSYLDSVTRVSGLGLDTIQNWQTVSHFNRIDYERSRFEDAVRSCRKSWIQCSKPLRWSALAPKVVSCLGIGSVCLLGCYQILHSDRSAGDFAMLFQFWTGLISPMNNLVGIVAYADRFLADNHKIIEILRLETKVRDKEDATDFKLGKGSIEFNHVQFSYDGQREVVKDVSFKIEGGKTVAIVGETGGGKSTMFKLLCRAYDVTAGSVEIDGQDVRDVRMATLRDHISIVPQNIGVFNTTIYENLRYANLDATREQIEDACIAAALHKRILSLTNAYEEQVGEKGAKLSGGELQRLAIARALLRKTQIVLFDKATSNLDAETEDRIQTYLKKWYQGRTVIVVAHRLATVSNADMIISAAMGTKW
ncbi:P-loop containing nucleoside triphosphate hydrolase protein [Rhypophila decipiens]|uniref:P-loop containing nucleoside triphosphate hydrolase protein n=1 Tax=Rhypophila decipiens TaxID=261697 RepID=A0AAN6YIE1_9PEZI|nr:P-loop containing nucleoside triphosphate hydrolase protein [Rhypophila decipiens]